MRGKQLGYGLETGTAAEGRTKTGTNHNRDPN